MWCSQVVCLFLVASSLAQDFQNADNSTGLEKENLPKPIIKYLHYNTDIENRYATTVVSSNVANPANKSQEVNFGLVLPDTAFISGFVMVIKNKEYKAYVKEKEEAKQDYDAAVAAGQSAAHIQQDVRDSNRFQVSVNVEAEGKVLFNLTYEELLTRTLGNYKNVINVNPGQIVKNLLVRVHVKEPVPITRFSVPKFRTKNEISSDKEEDDKLAVIEHDTKQNPSEASVTWAPSTEDQTSIAKDGLQGQLIVEYDVARTKSSQILLDEGYFVHFFTPNETVTPLAKHVVFVLDISGSMSGRKMEQLKEAMLKILSDLNEKDYFSIVLFGTDITVWSPSKTQFLFTQPQRWNSYDNNDEEAERMAKKRDGTEILLANGSNIEAAKTFVNKIYSTDATNIMGGLREGIDLINKGQQKFLNESNKVDIPQPVIVFLTDGQPNVDTSDPNEIVKKTVELNEIKTPIYSLAFGDGADLQFLRRLSLKNHGFARNIYEASDSALQLNNFYQEISSPLLAGVDFSYLPGQVENGTLTTHQFPVLFRGSEIVIAGKLSDENLNGSKLSYDFSATKNSDSSIDYKGPESSIFILPYPRPLPPPEANKTFGHLEKLWGYLTIKQLLDKDTSNKDDSKTKSPEKEQALQLALKYSFVTPLTSLVVVKPNSSESAVEPEKASSSQFVPKSGMYHLSSSIQSYPQPVSNFYHGSSGGTMNSYSPPAASFSHVPSFTIVNKPNFSRRHFKPSHHGNHNGGQQSYFSYNQLGGPMGGYYSQPPPFAPLSSGNTLPPFGGIHPTTPHGGIYATSAVGDLTTPAQFETEATTFSISGPDGATPVPHVQGGAKQIPLENITWLTNYTANHDNFVIDVPTRGNFTVGYNQTDTLYGDCNVPNEFNGHCRHLQYCTLSKFVNSVEEYVPYFCPISNSFAGVCCPPNL